MKAIADRARKTIFLGIAVVCLILGLLTVWTPLPTGVPLIALSILILVSVSATARRLLRRARARSDRLDRSMAFVETRAHRNMSTMLKRTRPLARKLEAKRALGAANAALHSARAKVKKREN